MGATCCRGMMLAVQRVGRMGTLPEGEVSSPVGPDDLARRSRQKWSDGRLMDYWSWDLWVHPGKFSHGSPKNHRDLKSGKSSSKPNLQKYMFQPLIFGGCKRKKTPSIHAFGSARVWEKRELFWILCPQNKHGSPETGGPLGSRDSEIGNHHFQVPAVNFWGCTLFFWVSWLMEKPSEKPEICPEPESCDDFQYLNPPFLPWEVFWRNHQKLHQPASNPLQRVKMDIYHTIRR